MWMKHMTYFLEMLYEMSTTTEHQGPYILSLKISNKNMGRCKYVFQEWQ